MGDEVYKNQQETKYQGLGNVPFPNASQSLKQREEQAFYEANSCDQGRLASYLAEKYRTVVKVMSKLLKSK
ncbi:hypothetical protein [Marinomonas sp.]|uniref:hypothetical protein n=1 Tax=Marinomonas sp. TaxID=1904862 RepID=UPI003BA90B24